MRKNTLTLVVVGLSLTLFAAGCKKKVAVQPPPAPKPQVAEAPRPPAPTIQFAAEPGAVEKGQAATLRWTVRNATEVSLGNGLGSVAPSGSRQVFPGETTTYTLMAKGPGGTADASATVDVTVPPPAAPPKTIASLARLIEKMMNDAYFDYDKSTIRADARDALLKDADAVKQAFREVPEGTVVIEGNCDERGSAEYNLALGDRRAAAAREFLVSMGVPPDRLTTVSYGKERPQCTDHDEACWQQNRRDHFEGK